MCVGHRAAGECSVVSVCRRLLHSFLEPVYVRGLALLVCVQLQRVCY